MSRTERSTSPPMEDDYPTALAYATACAAYWRERAEQSATSAEITFELLEVPAKDVLDGDWVRWPVQSQTVRKITEFHQESETVWLRSDWDAYEYELIYSQPVLVWRPK